MEDAALLYVTCANDEEAKSIARALVNDGLIACANILGPIISVYRWEGAVAEDGEVAMILKTRSDMTLHVTDRIKVLHSYDVPCVISLPVQGGNPDFLAWLNGEVD